ncbi:MAG: NADH-quinone oxidoreductase subunit NuoG [Arenicellales bacterium]
MSTIKIQVDGQTLEAQAGQMLIEVTDQAGIHIPRFCYHPKLSIAANCRMCLVDVENAPKPLPACATPVNDGMVVQTQSELAKGAQDGTMEFLLINHPLDCPICDQGGECPLQEQSIDYGANASRYHEPKRLVKNDNIGPLIATWMTRCIHCTRCVRFGEEIAGVMELGMMGRGEHAKIKTFPTIESDNPAAEVDAFLNGAVDSELSGNVIELCPVGALTALPSKYAARVWEMQNHASVSPHDCVGTNINIQTLRGEIKRTVVRENPEVNQYWLADRDRFAYEGGLSDARLTRPMIKDQHGWREVDWDVALKHAAAGIITVKQRFGATSMGALANASATVEELFLVQKLMRTLGSNNIDHRLRQEDFRDDFVAPLYPGSELAIAEFETLDAALLVGSNIRKEQPLLGLFLRQAAVKNSAEISAINLVDYDFHFPLANKQQVTAKGFVQSLANVALAVSKAAKVDLDESISLRATTPDAAEKAIAKSLLNKKAERKAIILGSTALNHFEATALAAIADWICHHTSAKLVKLPEGNSAGAWVAGCVPHRAEHGDAVGETGLNAKRMLTESEALHAYLLYGVEPGLDAHRSGEALGALEAADFVVQCSAFTSDEALLYADVLLPIATYTETSGSYINCAGRVQGSRAAADPAGEARPGWKVLRVLANYLELDGFEHKSLADVQDDFVLGNEQIISQRGAMLNEIPLNLEADVVYRHVETPMYRTDMMLRHATALQKTSDNPSPAVGLNASTIQALGLAAGEQVQVKQGAVEISLPLVEDNRMLDNSAFIPAGLYETSVLSGLDALTITNSEADA